MKLGVHSEIVRLEMIFGRLDIVALSDLGDGF